MAFRIGMILDKEFPPDSRVENEAVSLIEAGFEVYLFALSFGNAPQEESIKGIHVIRYKAGIITYKLSALAYTLPFYHMIVGSMLKDFIRIVKPDAIHIHDMQVARSVFKTNNSKLPVVLDLHENRPEIMRYYRHVKTWKGRLLIDPERWKIFQNQYIARSDFSIVVTNLAKDDIVCNGVKDADEVVVVPNTVHKSIFLKYEIDSGIITKFKNRFNILYLGDTGLRRGTGDAIKAIGLLRNKIPDINLILVGSNNEDPQLKALVSNLGLERHVVFEGWKDVTFFPSYIEIADVCISPLKRNPHHDTTYANKLFQYMALGKPVVVSDCPAQADVVQSTNSGLIYQAGDIDDFAEKILVLYTDKSKKDQFGKNGKMAVAEVWNWERTSRDLVTLYKKLATQKTED